MKKRIKNVKRKKSQPKDDNYLLRISKGELLYKFYYFRPVAGRREHFEYRILTKEKANGMFEMVSYNFKKSANNFRLKISAMKALSNHLKTLQIRSEMWTSITWLIKQIQL